MDGSRSSRISLHRHDDALGCWSVATCVPRPELRGLVAALWFGEGQVSYRRDRILPNGSSFLLVNLGPPQYRIEAGPPEQRVAFRDIWISGLHDRPIETEAPHGSRVLGVAFAAAGIRPWLHQSCSELSDRVLPLADLLGDRVELLRERLLNTEGLAERFAVLEEWLIARLSPRFRVPPLVEHTLARLLGSVGRLPIEQLAADAGVSRRTLSAAFARDVGLSPKTLAKVVRFQSAIAMLGSRRRVPWAELSELCGYYDQSHLVRDFQRFSGCSPGDFLRRARPDASSVVVD